MQPKRQLSIKYIAALLLLVLFVAWLPANLVAATPLSPEQSEHHQSATHPCDDRLTTSHVSEPTHPHTSTLQTDTCQGGGCLQCSSCTAMNPAFTYSNQLPLRWEQHYLSHQGVAASKRLDRPPKS